MRIPLIAKTLPFACILAAALVSYDESAAHEPLPDDVTEPVIGLACPRAPDVQTHANLPFATPVR